MAEKTVDTKGQKGYKTGASPVAPALCPVANEGGECHHHSPSASCDGGRMSCRNKKFHWFPFYIDDWETDDKVKLMGPATRYLYIALLAHQWRHGSIPRDIDQLRRL